MLSGEFSLPLYFDIGAVFFFALSGALVAMRRGYDVIGVFTLAFLTGLGGALIRDAFFLQNGPPALTRDPDYILAVLAACIVGWLIGNFLDQISRTVAMIDAIGLGAYSVVGVAKALIAGLSIPAALMVGVINACGGGLLRDILIREEPLLLKPGQFYALVSLLASGLFVGLTHYTVLDVKTSALIAIAATFLLRFLTILFDWQTKAIVPWQYSTELKSQVDETYSQPLAAQPVKVEVAVNLEEFEQPVIEEQPPATLARKIYQRLKNLKESK
jgi:uncharacterized membrane protein YeiH